MKVAEIRALSDEELNAKLKELKSELAQMNSKIKEKRKTVYYCFDIEESQKEMKRKAKTVSENNIQREDESYLSAE